MAEAEAPQTPETCRDYLVLSHTHGLAPFANRLQKEERQIASWSYKSRYEKAWAGRLQSPLSEKEKHRGESFEPFKQLAKDGRVNVLTDSRKWMERFHGSPRLFGTPEPDLKDPTLRHAAHPQGRIPPVRLGAWFDGEAMQAPHLLIEDRGSWPGGLGAQVVGAMTIAHPLRGAGSVPPAFLEALEAPVDVLKSLGHHGLVQVAVDPASETQVRVVGWTAGWRDFHGHAFLASLGHEGNTLSALIEGASPEPVARYAVVVPVTVPPWPVSYEEPLVKLSQAGYESRQQPIQVPEELVGRVFWHDVEIDAQHRKLRVAGLDGLVGVTQGIGETLLIASQQALGVAARIGLYEKQVRGDIGSEGRFVPSVLDAMGSLGWL